MRLQVDVRILPVGSFPVGVKSDIRIQIQTWLNQVERHIAAAEVYIVRQRKLVAESEGDAQAKRKFQLRLLEEAQKRRMDRRERLREELARWRSIEEEDDDRLE